MVGADRYLEEAILAALGLGPKAVALVVDADDLAAVGLIYQLEPAAGSMTVLR